MRRFIVIGIAIFFVVAGGYYFYSRNTAKKEATYTVRPQTLSDNLSFSGKIDAAEKATLRFQTSGYLAWVGVKEGDTVKKFQTIASLDQAELRKNLKKYLNTYMSERWDFETDKKNYESKITNDLKIILDKAQFDLDSSVIDVEIKDLAVKYANLWSPIEGVITYAESPVAGVNITPTQAEFEVVNPDTVYFSATADQTDVTQLAPGKQGTVILDSFPEEPLNSWVDKISFVPKSGETGTVYEVKMTLPAGSTYRLGMTGDANFTLREKQNVLAVPTKDIKTEGGKKYVWLKVDGQKTKRFVTPGEVFDNLTEIKAGLAEGDVIFK